MKYVYRLNKKKIINCCFIYNEQDKLLYTVKQDFISFGETQRYFDEIGNEVAVIKQAFRGRLFDFYSGGVKVAELVRVRKFGVNPIYRLNDLGWNIECNFLRNEYYVKDVNGNKIMDVYIKVFKLPDLIEVFVYDEKNAFMCLMCAMALSSISRRNSD